MRKNNVTIQNNYFFSCPTMYLYNNSVQILNNEFIDCTTPTIDFETATGSYGTVMNNYFSQAGQDSTQSCVVPYIGTTIAFNRFDDYHGGDTPLYVLSYYNNMSISNNRCFDNLWQNRHFYRFKHISTCQINRCSSFKC